MCSLGSQNSADDDDRVEIDFEMTAEKLDSLTTTKAVKEVERFRMYVFLATWNDDNPQTVDSKTFPAVVRDMVGEVGRALGSP